MKEKIDTDTFQKIIQTCTYVSENAEHVHINEEKLPTIAAKIKNLKSNHWLSSNPYGLLDLPVDKIINFLIIYGCMNCCYWGEPKWTIQTAKGEEDGAFALIAALINLEKQKENLNFEEITFSEFKTALKGNVEIPLLKERYQRAKNISKIINSKMSGNFYLYIKAITTDTELFKLIITTFKDFKDARTYKGKEILFYKLAQLVTSDILRLRELKENIKVDYSHIIGCSDYKIPQILRGLGVLEYDEELSNLVDNKIEIEENSIYEIEIRANALAVINKLKELLPERKLIEISDSIWNLSQNKELTTKPYHRTMTITY